MNAKAHCRIRAAPRRVGQGAKDVHGDVKVLLNGGVLDQAEAGMVFPYDAVHVDFTLTKAA